ncbi:major allergen Api g 1, isoallergen 1-like [Phragmites australis]|uniref:major allergen Api g 1, isoallergen 1-like n=1 Tax=Phragmites australis TaxID=29695 RepID=UPI002D78C4DA|nr:major allergen Api g 1, isoallergen 1-like [Phragmites australis]
MVAGSFTEECAVAVSAELLWKVAFADAWSVFLPKACAGFIDAVEIDGDGGPGSITTMKLNPAVGEATVFKTRVLAKDSAARVLKTEVLEGGKVSAQLKSQVMEVRVEPAGKGACLAKFTIEYERLDGAPLSPEDQATVAQGYLGIVKKVEAYLVAHPEEYA